MTSRFGACLPARSSSDWPSILHPPNDTASGRGTDGKFPAIYTQIDPFLRSSRFGIRPVTIHHHVNQLAMRLLCSISCEVKNMTLLYTLGRGHSALRRHMKYNHFLTLTKKGRVNKQHARKPAHFRVYEFWSQDKNPQNPCQSSF